MGTVNVAAFRVSDKSGVQAADAPALLSENVTSSASSAQSNAMPSGANVVRIATDTTIRVEFGTSPTATSAGVRIVANTSEYFNIQSGQKVAVIDE